MADGGEFRKMSGQENYVFRKAVDAPRKGGGWQKRGNLRREALCVGGVQINV